MIPSLHNSQRIISSRPKAHRQKVLRHQAMMTMVPFNQIYLLPHKELTTSKTHPCLPEISEGVWGLASGCLLNFTECLKPV